MTTCLLMHHVLCMFFLVKCQIIQVTQPPYSPDLVPCDFWLFPKLKSPLKGKSFQTVDEILENTTGQLMAIGTVWGPKVPTLKRIKASLSYVCFLCLASPSINVYFFILQGWIPSGQTLYIHIFTMKTIEIILALLHSGDSLLGSLLLSDYYFYLSHF